MTSMDSQDQSDERAQVSVNPDPVHPKPCNRPAAAHDEIVHDYDYSGESHAPAPLASELGTPAVLLNQVVALEIGSCACPVGIHRWTGNRVCTILLTPTQAQVWARAGRLTLVSAEGDEYRLTVLAPDEGATATLGAHWPLREPAGRVRRIASATAHDVGDLLTFPAWLARTAHVSGERNHQLAQLINHIRKASPATAVHYGQTFGHEHAGPDQFHPYDHKGLVGHEGYPHEL